MPVNERLCRKLTINVSLSEEEYAKLSEDQVDTLVSDVVSELLKDCGNGIAAANERYGHLGVRVSMHEDL